MFLNKDALDVPRQKAALPHSRIPHDNDLELNIAIIVSPPLRRTLMTTHPLNYITIINYHLFKLPKILPDHLALGS
jgi:hypothetical protein